MKALIAVMVLLLAASAAAEPTPDNTMQSVKSFFSSVNPYVLIVGGILLILASSLAKFIGAILLLVGIVGVIMAFI